MKLGGLCARNVVALSRDLGMPRPLFPVLVLATSRLIAGTRRTSEAGQERNRTDKVTLG